MRVSLGGVVKAYGANTVLDRVDLALGARTRLGLVGRNGVGKSTLLRLLAGVELPDQGRVERTPATLTVGYLPQEHDRRPEETLLGYLARRTGVDDAQAAVERHTTTWDAEAYGAALERFLALGGGDLEHRARTVCAELGLDVSLEQETATLSGGEAARAGLAAILLSRFDLLLLDEPTNDLDFDGLERLERFVAGFDGGLAVVSHDRAFLDRTIERIAEIDPWTHRVSEWAGTWSDYEAARDLARARQYEAFADTEERRSEVEALLAARRNQARAGGGMAERRGTKALAGKVRQARRSLERIEHVEKPYEPWQLRLSLNARQRPGDRVAVLEAAVGVRGDFRLGPIDLELAPGERVAITGRNGSGKSTLLAILLGELPLTAGRRVVGRSTVIGSLDQRRQAYDGSTRALVRFVERTGLTALDARTLLAKFNLGADHVERACETLSPGERTRLHLAELMARGV
ncbi:MAG: ABC-F family ATP-binding cassette domain-containing protein, partial [Actinobacteria bacterium]|nr:ABC-F family ATP-binding cassette domain-containing protein [Actinomycetota bacterium]